MSSTHFSALKEVSPALTIERLSKALSNWFGENVSFTHWEYVGETGKGDAFLSELIRIRIIGTNQQGDLKNVQIVLKYIPKNTCRRLTFRSDEFFRNEINFYNIVLPSLLKFQSDKSVKEPFKSCVKLFFSYCDGLNDVICLEDASLEGFTPAVRQEGIDFDHCKQIFKTLAQYHAISFAMKDQEPEVFDKIKNAIFETYYDERLWDWYERFWKRICGVAIDAVGKEYPDSVYLDKVKQFAVPERYKDMVKAAKTYDTGVFSHGDSWTNNFLFKYEGNKAVDAKILDFQLARCASPVLDVSFVIYACTTQDMRVKYYDDLLEYYYKVLSNQVREMGSDPEKLYSWDTFMDEVKKYSFFGLAFSFESTPAIVLDPEDAVSMEIEGDEKRNIEDFWMIPPFKTKEGRLREANNVVFCVDKGYI